MSPDASKALGRLATSTIVSNAFCPRLRLSNIDLGQVLAKDVLEVTESRFFGAYHKLED